MWTGEAGASRVRRELAREVLSVLARWGYEEETLPAWLDYEGLRPALHSFAGEGCKFIGPEGDVRLLLPDATLGVLTLWREGTWSPNRPVRVAYETEVYRSVDGPWHRLRQVGAELLYVPGAAGDAEVLATALESLQVVPQMETTVVINDVRIAGTLVELAAQAAFSDEQGRGDREAKVAKAADEMLSALARGDFVSLENLLAGKFASPLAQRAWRWLTLRGSLAEVRAGLTDVPTGAGSEAVQAALDHLAEVSSLAGGPQPLVDLGLLRDLGYYDNFVFQVVASGAEGDDIVAGGGRYDGLFGAFSQPVPAAGFAVDLSLLSRAWGEPNRAKPDYVVQAAGNDARALRRAWQEAAQLRSQGYTVVINTSGQPKGETTDASS